MVGVCFLTSSFLVIAKPETVRFRTFKKCQGIFLSVFYLHNNLKTSTLTVFWWFKYWKRKFTFLKQHSRSEINSDKRKKNEVENIKGHMDTQVYMTINRSSTCLLFLAGRLLKCLTECDRVDIWNHRLGSLLLEIITSTLTSTIF